ncbi:MAG: efflux RND transporter periplasmic adaptor subunit [Clostridia bacterium]|nr:efflux RND transporter periplasmic adaptor subunit [Clostridia bacterium]
MKKIVIVIGVLVVIAVGALFALNSMNSMDVKVFNVKMGEIQEYVEVRGKVDLETKEKVYSKLEGIVKEIMVKEGQNVDVNTKLAAGDAEDLDIAIKKAQSAYEAAKAKLDDLKGSIKPEQVKQAQAQVEQAKKAAETARKDYQYKKEKLDKLRALKGSNEQNVKDAEMLVAAAENALSSAEQSYKIAQYNLDMLSKGPSKNAIKAQEASVEQAKIQLDEVKNKTGKVYAFSGIKGTVLSKNIEEGSAVQAGTLLFEIGDYDSAYIRVDVLTDDAGKVEIGQKAVISGEALNDKEIVGEIYYIAPKAESTISSLGVEQQRIEMRIKFDNSSLKLRPGYGVDVKIVTQEKKSAVYVPEKAVFDMDGKDTVFIVKDGKVEARSIKIGMENKDYVEIIEGISEGEEVVDSPDNNLKPGTKVK